METVCSCCDGVVSVDPELEWSDGDLCWPCCTEYINDAKPILDRVAAMTACLCNEISGACLHCQTIELLERSTKKAEP